MTIHNSFRSIPAIRREKKSGRLRAPLIRRVFPGAPALNQEEDKNTRPSPTRRFYRLAKKHARTPGSRPASCNTPNIKP